MFHHDERRYQIFVSSTFTDLQEERQRALQAILEMHCFPAGMELFPSADDEQWEFIQREIDSSDYYVVILAGKYGSLAPDGVSFTEKEYDYAVSKGKPVMGFLFHDLGQLKGAQLEEDPARRLKLEAFHVKAKAGRLVKFYKNPDDLKAQIWQALTHAVEMRPAEGWVRGKNSRRLEDLEEINSLRKAVGEMEKELANLRSASLSHEALAQGDDPVEWKVQFSYINEMGEESKLQCTVGTSWNEILATLFDHNPVLVERAREDLEVLLLGKALEKDLLLDSKSLPHITSRRLDTIVRDVRLQFEGLGYIDALQHAWNLTQKGKLHVALLLGKRRPNVSPNPD